MRQPMESILVKDHMDRDPHAIQQNTSVEEAVEMLLKHKITGAPVVDDRNHLVGFLSEQDCIQELLNDSFYASDSPWVSSVMNKTVKTVSPENSIIEIAEAMAKQPPKNYPVVEDGKLVGLLSRRLILKALLETNMAGHVHA